MTKEGKNKTINMTPTVKNDFLVDRSNFFKTTFSDSELTPLEENEVLLKIDKYAFTSNNITYAVVGEQIKYWDFFPAETPWGIVPVWGFAEVVASKNEAVKIGDRYYGYFPMSNYLKVNAGKVKPHGFVDISEHRSHLAAVYNFYNHSDYLGMKKEHENYLPIIRPLFATAFLIYHFLKDNNFHEAENIILTSASSKTALGLAFLLNKNKKEDGKKIIGLTSDKNVEFVKNTNYYDEVISYKNAVSKIENKNTIIVDFAGNANLLNDIYQHLNSSLKHAALIGLTDWKSYNPSKQIPVAKFFFAPTHMQNKYKEWGPEKTNLLMGKNMQAFITDASAWIDLVFVDNKNDVAELYINMLKGEIDPSKGYIVKI